MPPIFEVVGRWTREDPHGVALCAGERAWTWAQLAERLRRVAGALRAAGIGPGDRVAFLDKNHPGCLETTLACSLIGAANAVINFRLAPEEIAYVLRDARARILFVGAEVLPAVESIRAQLTDVERVVVVGGPDDAYEAWLSAAAPAPVPPADGVALDDCFLQLYTSGTTGHPKGAMLTHRSLGAHGEAAIDAFRFTRDSVNVVAMPLFHVGGTSWALAGMTVGARTVIVRDVVPGAVLDTLARERATHAFFVPAVFGFFLQLPDVAARDYSSLRCLGYGGSPMPLPLLERCLEVFPVDFYQVYGMTEASGVFAVLAPEDHRATTHRERLASAGRPVRGVEVKVLDPVTHAPVATGEVGEFCIRSAQCMRGYFNDPKTTTAVIVDGWLHTGDAGCVDEAGYLFIQDRVKDMVISGGENVYPAEVERVLAAHPGVAEVAVIGVPDARWGEAVKAVVVARSPLEAQEILAYARTRLAGYKCPRSVDFVAALPRNATGKVLKRTLREPYWVGHARQV